MYYSWQGGGNMVEKLRMKAIYDDFLSKTNLTEEQIKIIDKLIKKETLVKISLDLGMSKRTLGYEIKKIKKLYEDYAQLEIVKLLVLIN